MNVTEPVSIVATGTATIGATFIAVITNDPNVFAGAVVVIIAALVTGAVQIINARSASHSLREAAAERLQHLRISSVTSEVVKETAKKADVIVGATEKIHELTNSTNSNLQSALDVMVEKLAGQDKVIAELRAAKVDTAAAQALTDQRSALTSAPAVTPPASSPAKVEMVNSPESPGNVTNVTPKP